MVFNADFDAESMSHDIQCHRRQVARILSYSTGREISSQLVSVDISDQKSSPPTRCLLLGRWGIG